MMPKRTWLTRPVRITIMCTLITLFFVISPLVILYTAGYRFDWNQKKVLQTGVISIDIEPRDARAVLNGVVIDKRLPIRLTNRAPGMYTLLLERNGYHNWQETIDVQSRQTTYIRDITLFADSLPVYETTPQIATNTTGFAHPYATGVYMFHSINQGVHEVALYNTTEQTYTPLVRTTAVSFHTLDWSPFDPDAALLILSVDENTVHTYHLNTTNATASAPIETTTVPRFHPHANTYYVQTDTDTWVDILDQKVSLANEAAVPIHDTPNNWYRRIAPNTVLDPRTSSTIVFDTYIDSILLEQGDTIIATYDETLLAFQKEKTEAVLIETWQHPTQLLEYGDDYLIATPWSLSLLHTNGRLEVLLRTSNQIVHTSLLANDRREVILTHADSIEIFDPRFNSFTTLTKNTTLGGAVADSQTTHLYFLGNVGRQQGLFELAL